MQRPGTFEKAAPHCVLVVAAVEVAVLAMRLLREGAPQDEDVAGADLTRSEIPTVAGPLVGTVAWDWGALVSFFGYHAVAELNRGKEAK